MGDNQNAILFSKKSLEFAKLVNKRVEARDNMRIARSYHGISDYATAIEYYNEALKLYKEVGIKHFIGGCYLNMGALYLEIPDYEKSLDSHQKALEVFTSIHDLEAESSCYFNISEIYEGLHENIKALEYIDKAQKIFETLGKETRGMAVAYNARGRIYMNLNSKELMQLHISLDDKKILALQFQNRSLIISRLLIDNSLIAAALEDIGKIYDTDNQVEKAMEYFNKSLLIKTREDDKSSLASLLNTIGTSYLKQHQLTKSIQFLKESNKIAISAGALAVQKENYQSLSIAYENKNAFDSSLFYYKEFIAIRDSIYSEQREKDLTRKKLQMDFGIRERNYKLYQQLTNDSLTTQRLLAKQDQQQLAINQQQLKISRQEKNLQGLTFLQKQTEMEEVEKQQSAISFKQQLQSKYEKKISDKQISNQNAIIKYNKQLNLSLSILAVIVLLVAIYIFYARRKTIHLNKTISFQKEELIELNNVKDKIFSVISHDMRAPVNQLISFTNLLEGSDIPKEKLVLYSAQLKNNLNYTSSLLENLLKWSSSQMNGFSPDIKMLNLCAIINDIVINLGPSGTQKNINIINEVSFNQNITADSDMMSLVMRNLLTNSLKFTPSGGSITINCTNKFSKVVINIIDTGVGLDAKKLDAINSTSSQPINSTYGTKKEKGTGLGLLLCKTFLTVMNGKLYASSQEGKGSIFTVEIPA